MEIFPLKYRNFLFDLDDTLLDFQASEKLSLEITMQYFNIDNSDDEFFKRYKIENEILWKKIEQNLITKEFLKTERFKKTLDVFGLTISADEMANYYMSQLPQNIVLKEGAVEVLKYLKPLGNISIITNGMMATQLTRIQKSELKDYINFICVSEECGFAKPDTNFFQYTMDKTPLYSKEETIIIGDRLEADIKGAISYGIDSIWYNHDKTTNETAYRPTYEIQSLHEIITILKA